MGVAPEVIVGVIGSVIMAIAVSRAIWWATRRNAFWAMGAGVLVTLAMLALVVAIAWLMATAAYGR